MDTLEKIRQAKGKGQAKTDFLLHRELIATAAAAGHSKRVIWRVLQEEGKFRASYPQFLAYMAELLPLAREAPEASPKLPVNAAPMSLPKPSTPSSAAKPTFKFDPFKPDILKVSSPRNDTPAKP